MNACRLFCCMPPQACTLQPPSAIAPQEIGPTCCRQLACQLQWPFHNACRIDAKRAQCRHQPHPKECSHSLHTLRLHSAMLSADQPATASACFGLQPGRTRPCLTVCGSQQGLQPALPATHPATAQILTSMDTSIPMTACAFTC